MPSTLPPPPPSPSGSPAPSGATNGRKRRAPWLLVALAVVLFLLSFGLVVVVRDRADAGDAQGSRDDGSTPAQAAPPPVRPGPPPTGDGPPPASASPAPGDSPGDTTPPSQGDQGDQGDQGNNSDNPLNDLLQRLMGSAG